MNPARTWLAVAAVMMVLAAGCDGLPAARPASPGTQPTATTARPTPTQEPVTDPASDPALARFYGQRPRWHPCGGGLQCARLTVPVDWSTPAGTTIRLALNRLPAAGPGPRIGTLFTNPGGPGGSGVEFVERLSSRLPAEVRARYDVVGFDPRGVGSSAPIHCLSDSQLDAFLNTDPTPTDQATLTEVRRQAKEFADACARNGPLLGNVGTPAVARDLDVMRAALGDATLNYLGYSYGTYLGAIYAGLFPTHVGRMVLDGVVDPALTTSQIALGQARGFELAYQSFVADCLSRGCALGTSAAEVTAAIEKMLRGTDAHPLRTAGDRLLSEALATTGILAGLYAKARWQFLRTALSAAVAGDGSGLLALADSYTERVAGRYRNNMNEAIYAVNCLDHPGGSSEAEINEMLPALRAASPLFGSYIGWGELPCHYWPVPATSQPGPVRAPSASPILVIGTTRDPATPYEWAKNLAGELASGVFLSHDGDGHTSFGGGNHCVDAAVDRYLLTGTPPTGGTKC